MIPHLEPEAPNTIKFLKYLVSVLLSREPLKTGKTILIPINEHSPNFPEFTDNILEGDQEPKIEDVLEDKARLALDKIPQIRNYLLEKFKHHTVVRFLMFKEADPFTCDIPFIILDPKGLYKMGENLGLRPQTVLISNQKSRYITSRLKKNPLRICVSDKEIPITGGTIQSRIVELMFKRPLNTLIELDELVDDVFGDGITNPSEKWKSVNNALYLVNKKVKEDIGEAMFKVGKVRYSRIK